MSDDNNGVYVGTMTMVCQACGEDLPIPVYGYLQDNGDEGTVNVVAQPDVSEVWSHAWAKHGDE